MEETHYVCTECRTVSKFPGTCQNENCIKMGERTVACHCEDGNHDMIFGGSSVDQDEEARRNGFSTTTIDLDNDEAYT